MKLIMLVRASCVYSPFIKKIFQEILWFSSAFEDCLSLVPWLLFSHLFFSIAIYESCLSLWFCNVLENCWCCFIYSQCVLSSVLLSLFVYLPSMLLSLCYVVFVCVSKDYVVVSAFYVVFPLIISTQSVVVFLCLCCPCMCVVIPVYLCCPCLSV